MIRADNEHCPSEAGASAASHIKIFVIWYFSCDPLGLKLSETIAGIFEHHLIETHYIGMTKGVSHMARGRRNASRLSRDEEKPP